MFFLFPVLDVKGDARVCLFQLVNDYTNRTLRYSPPPQRDHWVSWE